MSWERREKCSYKSRAEVSAVLFFDGFCDLEAITLFLSPLASGFKILIFNFEYRQLRENCSHRFWAKEFLI